MVADKGLSAQQRRFADAYLGEAKGNASEAARLAEYKRRDSGWDVLNNTQVRAYIDQRLEAETATSRQVLRELTDVAFAEWRDFLTIKQVRGQIVDVKMDLSSKVKALELLGKYHQLWDDKPNITVPLTVQIVAERIAAQHGLPIEAVYQQAEALLEAG